MKLALRMDLDGSLTSLDLDAPEGSLKVLQSAVQGYIEPVTLQQGTPGLCMYVNEEGLFHFDPSEINPFATLFQARAYGEGHIRGPVVLTGGVDRKGDTEGLTAEQAEGVKALVGKLEQHAIRVKLLGGLIKTPIVQ